MHCHTLQYTAKYTSTHFSAHNQKINNKLPDDDASTLVLQIQKVQQ